MSESRPQWFLPSGAARRDGCDVLVDDVAPRLAAHRAAGRARLDAGERWSVDEPGWEYVVVPLAGAASVDVHRPGGTSTGPRCGAGRRSSPAAPTSPTCPRGRSLEVTGTAAGPGSRSARRGCAAAARRRRRSGTSPPTRSRSSCAVPAAAPARSATSASPDCSRPTRSSPCEVVTPAGNWSSYPPHKHDEERDGVETELEEIYYFETQVDGGPAAAGSRPGRLPAGLRHRRAAHRRLRRGAHR